MSKMPKGWVATTLVDIVKPRDKKVMPSELKNVQFIGMDDIEPQTFRLIGSKPIEELSSSVAVFEEGDVLYGRLRPYLNKVHRAQFAGAASAEFIVIPPSKAILSEYLLFLLGQQDFVQFAVMRSTGDRPRVKFEAIGDYPVKLPPFAEQRRIVTKLNGLFAHTHQARKELEHIPTLIEYYKQVLLAAAFRGELTAVWREANKQLLLPVDELLSHAEAERKKLWKQLKEKDLTQGKYKPALDIAWKPNTTIPENWIWVSVDHLVALTQYGTSSKTSEEDLGIPVLRMGNIKDGKLDFSSLKYLPTNHDEFPKLILDAGDILFNRTNSAELVGKSATVPQISRDMSFASYLIRLKSAGMLPQVLTYYINSPFGRDWVASVVTQQVGQANVNGTKLRHLGVPLMSPAEQVEIQSRLGAVFDWLDTVGKEVNDASNLLDHLEQATLAKAFRGEFVPQDPNDEPASVLLERIREARAEQSKKGRKKK